MQCDACGAAWSEEELRTPPRLQGVMPWMRRVCPPCRRGLASTAGKAIP